MELQQVAGKDIREALERTRDALGERAVVVSHSRSSDGRVVLAVSNDVPGNVQALQALRVEAARILKSESGDAQDTRLPMLGDVERRMRMSGCSPEFIADVVEKTRARQSQDGHPLDTAADVIGEEFPIARARIEEGVTPFMAFLGPTGVGKTTTIAKLAARLARAGRRVALTTFDRGSVVSSLQAYGRVLGLPYLDAGKLDWSQAAREYDVVLLDTSGNVERDVRALEQLRQDDHPGLRIDPYLVFSASHNEAVLGNTAERAAPLNPVGCVVTKLDEVPLPGPIVEQLRALELPSAFLCDGASFKSRFHRSAPERFADLCLRGRLS